jgi:hypothetical protein
MCYICGFSDDEDDEDYEPPHESSSPIDADNYIQDFQLLRAAIENNLECSCCREKWSKRTTRGRKPKFFHTLEVTISMHRFATEVDIQCAVCDFKVDANPMDKKSDHVGKSCWCSRGNKGFPDGQTWTDTYKRYSMTSAGIRDQSC